MINSLLKSFIVLCAVVSVFGSNALAQKKVIVSGQDAEDIIALIGATDLTRAYSIQLIGYVSEKQNPQFDFQAFINDGDQFSNISSDQGLIERAFEIAVENDIRVGFHAAGSSYKNVTMSAECVDSGSTARCTLIDESIDTANLVETSLAKLLTSYGARPLIRQCLEGLYPSGSSCPTGYELSNCATAGGHFGAELCSCCSR